MRVRVQFWSILNLQHANSYLQHEITSSHVNYDTFPESKQRPYARENSVRTSKSICYLQATIFRYLFIYYIATIFNLRVSSAHKWLLWNALLVAYCPTVGRNVYVTCDLMHMLVEHLIQTKWGPADQTLVHSTTFNHGGESCFKLHFNISDFILL